MAVTTNYLVTGNGITGSTANAVQALVSGAWNYFSDAEKRRIAKDREFYEVMAYPAIYFDPSLGADTGDGTPGNPFRDLTAARLTPGRHHLIKAGTTIAVSAGSTSVWLSPTVTGTAQAPIIIGRYGSGDNPKINGTGAQRGIRFGSSSRYFRVRDLELYGFSAGSDRYGVSVNSVDATGEQNTTRAIVLERLTIRNITTDAATDCNGIKLYGADNEILDCQVYNIASDGIWFHGFRTLVQGCTVYQVAQDGRNAGDCIQCGAKSDGSVIRGNLLDHRNADFKQCIYFEPTISISDGVLIEDNTCYGFDGTAGNHTPIFCGATNSIVRRNYVTGGYQGITINAGGECYSNVVIATAGNGIQCGSARLVAHNTVVQTGPQTTQALSCGLRSGTSSNTQTQAFNNVIIGFYNAILAVTSAVDGRPTIAESNNTFATQGVSEAHYRLDGTVVTPVTGAQIVAFASALTTLGLDANYRPVNGGALSAAIPGVVSLLLDKDQRSPHTLRGAYAA